MSLRYFFNKIFNQTIKQKRVFLDFASSTPLRPEVLDVYLKNKNFFYNPSGLYIESRESKDVLEKARGKVALVLNCQKETVVWTSGGTESNNLAILGVFEKAKENGIVSPHVISLATEHPSVIEVFEEIKKRGGEVTLISPGKDGLVTPEQIVKNVKENTVLVSVMFVNNEIGTVQNIKEIGLAIRKYKKEKYESNEMFYPYFHTDACQAPLYYSLDTSTLCVDLLSIDGLKIYGPRGFGSLYVRQNVPIKPIFFGGGQEIGLRSGTENVFSASAFAKSLSLSQTERKENFKKVSKLRDYFLENILKEFPEVEVNGSLKYRSPNNINICFKGLDAEYLVVALDTYGVCASYSSSCRTLKEDSSSYVVEALGKTECKDSSLRFTLGLETTKEDLDFTLVALKKAVKQVEK